MVSAKVRKRIDSAVRKLGYVPNRAARLLATGRSNVIGVVIPSVTNNVFSNVLRGIYAASEGSEHEIQLANTRYSPLKEEGALRLFASQNPTGLILTGFDQNAGSCGLLKSLGCPVVRIMETGSNPGDACVGFSHTEAARAATEHLLSKGYRKLSFLGARMDPRTQRRFMGFKAAAEAAGSYSEERVVTTVEASSVTKGGELLAELLSRTSDVDAVFCNNDDLALGALFEARRRRIDVPRQLGICGFNDLEMMAAAEPSLTSVRTPRFEMGQRAVELILAGQERENLSPANIDLGFEVIGRMSTDRESIIGVQSKY